MVGKCALNEVTNRGQTIVGCRLADPKRVAERKSAERNIMLPADGSSTGVRAPIMQPGIRYMISPSNCEIRRGKTIASHCPKTLNQYPRPHRDYAGRRTNLSKKLAG